MTKKKRSPLAGLSILLLVVAGGLALAWKAGYLFEDDEDLSIDGAPVRRGALEITVTERGNLTAKNSVSIKSEVEGRSTLLYIIGEGAQVEIGDLIAEIDTSELQDRRVAQQITVQSARAAATKARESLEIQRIENESLIAKAKQEVEFAKLELEKYIGAELEGLEDYELEELVDLLASKSPSDDEVQGSYGGGNREQELQQFRDDILIREEELKRAEDRRDWSRELAEKGFVERTELEADELAYTRAGIMLEQAGRALFLLEKYEHPKRWAELQGELKEAERQLLKSNKQAIARLADFEADKEATKVKLELEEEKLSRLLDQISKGKIYSPAAGMVVYGRTERSRYSGGEPIQEGGEVRERQEIVTIPGEGGMVAEASIHESALKQVVPGLKTTLRVDAMPGREFPGAVTSVAVLPDTNSWWANPNLRLYKTEVVVDGGDAEMRPGMSCSIEIHVDTIPDTLFVPVQAVHHSGGKTIAWVRDRDDVSEREVEVGRHNETWLEIRGGLTEGEIVLLSPPVGFQPEAAGEENSQQSLRDAGSSDQGDRASERGSESSKPSKPESSEKARQFGGGGGADKRSQ